MRSIAKISKRLSIAGLVVLMGMSASFANTLTEVQINAQNSGYGIVLKTDETPQMKKTVSSDDELVIQLKDVSVSPDLNTVYNNVANLDNVTVAPAGKDDIKIIFKGYGISNSKIYFENAKTLVPKLPAKESINLSAPVSSYTPVYKTKHSDDEVDFDSLSGSHQGEDIEKTTMGISSVVQNKLKKAISGDINLITILGVLFIIGAMFYRSKPKAQATKQPYLNDMYAKQRTPQLDREVALNRRMAENMTLSRPDGLGSMNSVNAGYGLRAYQSSQKNPYVSNTVTNGVSSIPRRKQLQNNSASIKRPVSAPVKRQTVLNRPVSNNTTTTKSVVSQAKVKPAIASQAASDMDSVKFLESITKIYEKNGRTDLAKGLKDNLRKAQATHSSGRTF